MVLATNSIQTMAHIQWMSCDMGSPATGPNLLNLKYGFRLFVWLGGLMRIPSSRPVLRVPSTRRPMGLVSGPVILRRMGTSV